MASGLYKGFNDHHTPIKFCKGSMLVDNICDTQSINYTDVLSSFSNSIASYTV